MERAAMRALPVVVGLMLAVTVHAAEVQDYYFGGGFGYNKVPEFTDAKTELQLFAGYTTQESFGLNPRYFDIALEAGYMDTSDADHDGWWLTPVLLAHVGPLTDLFVRAGGESGHDSGVVYGGGIAYRLEQNMAVRLEYVEHPKAHSLQVNVVYRPWRF